MTRAKRPYEGLEAYEEGYKNGYEAGRGNATSVSSWYWDENATGSTLGAWRCGACNHIGRGLPKDKHVSPYAWADSNYCANCGCRMVDVEGEPHKECLDI